MPARGPRPPVHERKIEEFIGDDSDDEDFQVGGEPRSARKRRSTKTKSKPNKRQRRHRSYDEDSVIDDSEDSEASFSEEEESEHIERDPVTGRPRRNAVKRAAPTYAESEGSSLPEEMLEDGDVIEDSADELAESPVAKKSRKKMIVKLSIPSEKLSDIMAQKPHTRTRATRSHSVRATSEARVTRASARNTAEPEELLELTDSGHTRNVAGKTVHKGTGGKGIKMPKVHPPSMIIEESQEEVVETDFQEEEDQDDAEDPTTQDPMVDSIEETRAEEEDGPVVAEESEDSDDDDDDDGPIVRRRSGRTGRKPVSQARSQSRSQKNKRSGSEDDYDPDADAEDAVEAPKAASQGPKRKRASSDSDNFEDEVSEDLDDYELMAEVEELAPSKRSRRHRISRAATDTGIQFEGPSRPRRTQVNVDYGALTAKVIAEEGDEEEQEAPRAAKGKAARSGVPQGLFNMGGPFGGTSHASRTLPFGPDARGLQLMADDSSDDDSPQRPPNTRPGYTPLTPHMAPPQSHPAEGAGPMGFGRVNAKKDMADVTPLAISPDIDFNSVGGLDDHINKLKEMVMLPLLYPELYEQWKVPPPRGVLFHGPPGTGKTLLARALASSVSVGDKKVTFFMRKGADVMSKWVGEAERQLRLLFDEAKKQQPAIIFFDEFDGLAPVRSSKQEQIHASIVTTLLSLMDGMDSRGQIVVIGATNRPDSIDPAFRRPGRFDREFYFPLPNQQARRAIIDIHTRGWTPPADPRLKNDLAEKTRGYGGSDLRALCTEAVINAIQRTYPQIYHSDQKLEFDKSAIKVIAKDFLLSMRRIVPSSERQSAAVAEPLPQKVEPLLRNAFDDIITKLGETIPSKRKHLTALEEAELEQMDEASGFDAEEMMRAFDRGRVFRPRMLLKGPKGMGQKYLAAAVLHHLEGFFVRNLDLATLTGDPAQSPEAILISAFKEARIHQPSVLLIPQINVWYETIGGRVVETFSSLLRTLSANDAVLLLGVMEAETIDQEPDAKMMRDLFGFSAKHEYRLTSPDQHSRLEFFTPLISYIRKRPSEFHDREDRRKRKLPELPIAKEEVKDKAPPSKAELKAQYKADRSTLNMLRLALTPVMREVKDKWRSLNKSIIADRDIEYLLREQDPDYVTSDLPESQRRDLEDVRPYELGKDKHGRGGLVETATKRFYYNCNTQIVEQRLSNGYYKRPKEYLHDLKTIAKDHKTLGILDKSQKANDMYLYAEAEVELIEKANPQLMIEAEAVYRREQEREKRALADKSGNSMNIGPSAADSTVPSGPIQLGVNVGLGIPIAPRTPGRNTNSQAHDSHHTNGQTVPSRLPGGDVDAMDVDTSSGSRPQFPAGFTQTPSNPTTYQSQQSGVHKMFPGSQLHDLQNSASTTTSGNKTSNRTSRDSDPRHFWHRDQSLDQTQSTNGNATQYEVLPPGHAPDFASMLPPIDGSQLPDTQSTQSKRHTMADSDQDDREMSNGHVPASQELEGQTFKHPGMPASVQNTQAAAAGASQAPPNSMAAEYGSNIRANGTGHETSHVAPIANILNPSTTPPPPPPPFVLDEAQLEKLHQWIGVTTGNLTVEQLEMIDARCMYTVYQSRSKWDRTALLEELREAVQEVLEDVAWQRQLSIAVAAAYAYE